MTVATLLAACVVATSPVPSDPSLNVSALSAIIMDAQTGKVLWSKGADVPRYPASTTKIMTAMLLLERCRPEEILRADKECEVVDGASMHLKEGETVSAEGLLRAILLRSANDACELAAKHIAGSIPAFVSLMNARAKEIGCTKTEFNNPHGLNDTLHTTTANDLALMARQAMMDPEFRKVVRVRKDRLSRSINHQDEVMVSKNKLLSVDPTADGLKTGYTRDAGHCFVGSATRPGANGGTSFRLITVVLKSEDWLGDTQKMLDWGFKKHERKVFYKAGQSFASEGSPSSVGILKDDVILVTKVGQTPRIESHIVAEPSGSAMGQVTFRDQDGFEQRARLVSASSQIQSRKTGSPMPWMLAGVAGFGAYRARSRKRKP